MEQNDTRNGKTNEKQESEENKLKVAKKKTGLLKKKILHPTKLYSNIDLKHVVNVGDICFANEESLRFPERSDETLLRALYSYKMISKVSLNNEFINIELKRNNDNLFPAEYFVERLRSFGDEQLSRIANHLENINRQFMLLKESCPTQQKSFVKDEEESLLKNFLEKMKGKKYFLYFNEITPQKIDMKNIIFSVPLLKALRCNLKNIALDFLKYKHVFFEVFTTKMYKFFLDKCFENFGKLQAELMARPDMSEEERQEITTFYYEDEVIRTKEGPEGIYEEISNAKVKWSLPHTSICCFEILEIDEAEGIKIPKSRKINHFEESKPDEELNELREIGISFPLLKIEDDHKNNELIIEAGSSHPTSVRNRMNRTNHKYADAENSHSKMNDA